MLELCEDRVVPTPVVTVETLTHATEGVMLSTTTARLTRTETTGSLMVNFTVGGTATLNTDYITAYTNSVTFMDGQATADVSFFISNDSESEPTETIILTITSGTGYTIGTPSSATMNIYDDDAQYVSVEKLFDAVEGGSNGVFRFTRIGDLSSGLTVNISVGGTATSGTDYTGLGSSIYIGAGYATGEVAVTALADNLVEGTETVQVTVSSGSGYNVGTPYQATMNITDDPPVVAVTATDTFEGAATGGFTFTRTGGNLAASLTVYYTVGGTADDEYDYEELSGSVMFAADVDRVEVPVTAFGDNLNDDGETVIVTISSGGSYYTIDEEADEATVTIADQPLTVSVIALADGEEGVSNGTFRFIRSGDLSEELTVYYTVSGTATSGTDFTALAGSVTFEEEEVYVDVTVYVTNDQTGEPTETVTVTLEEDEAYLLGNDSDTIFIRDNDTRRLEWIGAVDDDWSNQYNWYIMGTTTNAAPTEYDDVYFNASGAGDVTNVGYGLSTLYGLHIIGTYDGTLTLANALSVGTYEQITGTLVQDDAEHDLTITHALLWSGGTLGGTDDGADVTVDGAAAVGRIDPPNIGSMSIGSTLNVLDGVVRILPGILDFSYGEGMFINTDAKVEFILSQDLLKIEGQKTFTLAVDSKLIAKGVGSAELGNRVVNSGGLFKLDGQVKVTMTAGDVFTASYTQESNVNAKLHLVNGSTLVVAHGLRIDGGSVFIISNAGLPANQQVAMIVGKLTWTGGDVLYSSPITIGATLAYSSLIIRGDVAWSGGRFMPGIDCAGQGFIGNTLRVEATLTVDASGISKPRIEAIPQRLPPNQQPSGTWDAIFATKIQSLNQNDEPTLPEGWNLLSQSQGGVKKKWSIQK